MTKADVTPTPRGRQTDVEYDVSGVSGTRPWRDPAEEPADLPPMITLRAILSAYKDNPERQRALMAERGVTPATARRFGIGWTPRDGAWVLPIRNERGELVNLSYRPPHRQKARHPWRVAGRVADNGGLPLYPAIPTGRTWLLLAGEWDALAAIQGGLPGVTGLCGCLWHGAWNRFARGKRIAVLYDRGEEEAAEKTFERLRSVGAAETWVVKWPSSFADGYDVGKWFLEGRTADDLVKLIRRHRP